MEIKADRNFTISELKVAHRMKFADLKKVHAAAIEEKNHRIKAASKMLTDMHELHLELAAEIIQVKRNARLSGADVKKLKEGNTALKSRLMIQKQEMNSLIDEVRDKHNYMKSLEDKVSEYEDALDFMSNQYEDQEEEFTDIIACIDNFYSNEMTKLSPLFIKKHMVNNKKYKGAVSLLSLIHLMLSFLFLMICLMTTQANILNGYLTLTSL
jgi:chromosome segregation ATPase